jgi:hypothetical protein
MWEWRYSSTILDLAIDGGERSASRPGRFTPQKITSSAWRGGWVGPVLPWRESKPGHSARNPSLYRLLIFLSPARNISVLVPRLRQRSLSCKFTIQRSCHHSRCRQRLTKTQQNPACDSLHAHCFYLSDKKCVSVTGCCPRFTCSLRSLIVCILVQGSVTNEQRITPCRTQC